MIAWGCGKGMQKMTADGYRVSFWSDEDILEVGSGDGYPVL